MFKINKINHAIWLALETSIDVRRSMLEIIGKPPTQEDYINLSSLEYCNFNLLEALETLKEMDDGTNCRPISN